MTALAVILIVIAIVTVWEILKLILDFAAEIVARRLHERWRREHDNDSKGRR